MPRRSRCSPATCARCSSSRRSAASGSWRSTPAIAPAARSPWSTTRATCRPTTSCTPRSPTRRSRRRRRRSGGCASSIASRPSPSATAPPGARAESFVRKLAAEGRLGAVKIVVVNEAGASVYSASEVAREELPERGCHGARRGVDRAAAAGSAGRAGQDRSEVDRRRPVPARRAPGDLEEGARPGGRELRQRRRRRRQHRVGQAPAVRRRRRRDAGQEHRRLSRRKRAVPRAPRPLRGAAPRQQGVRAGGGLLARPRRREPARQLRGAPGELRRGRAHGARSRRRRRRGWSGAATWCRRSTPTEYVDERRGLPTLKDILGELTKPGRDPRGRVRGGRVRSVGDRVRARQGGHGARRRGHQRDPVRRVRRRRASTRTAWCTSRSWRTGSSRTRPRWSRSAIASRSR